MVGLKLADLFAHTTRKVASYVGQTYQHGGNIWQVVETFAQLTLPTPPAPPILPTRSQDRISDAIFHEQVKEYVKWTNKLEENIKSLWSLLWWQSSDAVHTHIVALPTFEVMQETSASPELLLAIQGLMFNVQKQKYKVLSVHLVKQ